MNKLIPIICIVFTIIVITLFVSNWYYTTQPYEIDNVEGKIAEEKQSIMALNCKELKEQYDGKAFTARWGDNESFVKSLLSDCKKELGQNGTP